MGKRKIELHIRGRVQGVGFRPFIYRLGNEMGIQGEVANRTDGVVIRACLTAEEGDRFIERIKNECPPVAAIHSIEISGLEEMPDYQTFRITPSSPAEDEITQVAPDIAVCPDCLRDRSHQPHRRQYPFINCTYCGPRFSIIRDLPYDRERTTMAAFGMCPACEGEYTDIADRRFHAQPVACNRCGPSYYSDYKGTVYTDYPALLKLTTGLLRQGEVIAVKGIGGYHLACDASDEKAVSRLRQIKQRDSKPFAVMFPDLAAIEAYARVEEEEKRCLSSWRRPVVLLRQRKALAPEVNPGMRTLGCLLPYMPVHYDWFAASGLPALVMTSGNISDRPICIEPDEAEALFGDKVALILHHNRVIHNRADDSVVQVCGKQPCLIRRSRGYAPEPFFADRTVEGILAFGAEKVNTFALGKGDTILQSQYIGDLKNWETFRFYTQSLERFRQLFRFTPRQLVCDLHPDYLSSREAERMAAAHGLPLLRVQHHHAHAVACMAEYQIDEPVIALILDGAGLGDDRTVWGGEFFLCDRRNYQRLSHLEYTPLPGGDKASEEPWRMVVSYLHSHRLPYPSSFIRRIGEYRLRQTTRMIEKKINCPLTSSAGRLFDAVASLLGLCDISTRQAEAPQLLEQCADQARHRTDLKPYPFDPHEGDTVAVGRLLEHLTREIDNPGITAEEIAYRFHLTLAELLAGKAVQLLWQTGAKKVVAGGGCFQNRLLTELLQDYFSRAGIPLYIPSRLPCNDSGISAGQIIIAAHN